MIFIERRLKGMYEINLNEVQDERGFFLKSYDKEVFDKFSLHREWVQENHSGTMNKGTIRGFHFQLPPYSETKLVRCTKGAVLNVFVDLRKDSSTFGQWDAIELSKKNRKMAYIPKMFANGFCILEDESELIYKSDNVYMPDYERRIAWNDKTLNIDWPIKDPILSSKDKENGFIDDLFEELEKKF